MPTERFKPATTRSPLFGALCSEPSQHAGAVLAFEPLPQNFKLVEKSVNDNGFDNVTLSPLALSNVDGEATLRVPGGENSGAASLVAGRTNNRVVPVQCARLDAVLGDDPPRRVDLIKVDVEGFEPEVLGGSTRTLAHDQPMVLFEVNDLDR
jgi:FkbM family methyltransferase